MKLTKIAMPEKKYLENYTLRQIGQMKVLGQQLAESTDSGKLDLTWEAQCLASYAAQHSVDVLSARAEFAGNCRKWDDETETIDVWIDVLAHDWDSYWSVGGYLSDIWQISGSDDRALAAHMTIRHFVEER